MFIEALRLLNFCAIRSTLSYKIAPYGSLKAIGFNKESNSENRKLIFRYSGLSDFPNLHKGRRHFKYIVTADRLNLTLVTLHAKSQEKFINFRFV